MGNSVFPAWGRNLAVVFTTLRRPRSLGCDDARSARRQTSLIERVNIGALKTQIEPHAIAVDRNGWESIIMRQHRGLHVVGVLGLLACAGW